MIKDAFICQLIPPEVVDELVGVETQLIEFAERAVPYGVNPDDPMFRMSIVAVWLVREVFEIRKRVRLLRPLS